MIYFDQNKEAYNNRKTLENWGNTCIYSCEDDKYKDFLLGKYIWNENNELVLNPEWDDIVLNKIKQVKYQDNDAARDIALNQGVTYNNILFDSDTDQKINLLATVSQMSETDTVEWFGMNNDSLVCTKQDLINIGSLITALHSFCWTKNAEIKEVVRNASTVEEIKTIQIDYTLTEE